MSGPPMTWLRLYTDFVYNRKVIRLPEVTQLRLVKLWCLHQAGHLVGATTADLAFELRLSEPEVIATLETLTAAGFLEADGSPHDWASHQYSSDNTTARTRAFRERSRERSPNRSQERDPARSGERAEQSRAEQNREEQTAPGADDIPYGKIIAHLNERTGSSFRQATRSTRTLIHARWADGYRLDDFKAVIDVKVAEWGNDPKWAKYLCPGTLFSPKFEGYREAARRTANAAAQSADNLPDLTTLFAKEPCHV